MQSPWDSRSHANRGYDLKLSLAGNWVIVQIIPGNGGSNLLALKYVHDS